MLLNNCYKKVLTGFLFFISLFIISISCDSTETQIIPSVDTVSNTIILKEEWTDLSRIKIKLNKSILDTLDPFTYLLTQTDDQGNKLTQQFKITGKDTTFISGDIDSLQQGKTYSFFVEAYSKDNKLKDTSKTIMVKTLSPTSHSITWQIDTLGITGNFLIDVWGLNENNIWAVGRIWMLEGQTGVIFWNGIKWNYHSSPGAYLESIYGFNNNQLVVAGLHGTNGFVAIWDGDRWKETNFFNYFPNGDTVWALRSIWGNSPDDVWAVGDKGTIIHWDGRQWSKINAGILTTIKDIWGISSQEVYLITDGYFGSLPSEIYKYDGTSWDRINIVDIYDYTGNTVWKLPGGKLLAGGKSILEFTGQGYHEIIIQGRTRYVLEMYGSNINNLFTVGVFGEITHFDGLTWKNISDFEVPDGRYRALTSVWCNEKKVFIVGEDENRAIIITGIIN
jgi:hypothetical protein